MGIKKIIDSFPYEKRVLYLALNSVILNGILAVLKFIIAYIYKDRGGGFFLVFGAVNIFILLAKVVCYITQDKKEHFKFNTFLVGLFMITSGILYTIYMARLLFFETMHIDFPTWLSIVWATIAMVEIVLGVRGLFKVRGKGHMYRNIMLINLGVSLYAIVLTQVMLISVSLDTVKANYYDAIFGIIVGGINIILGIFIWITPKISLVDKMHNEYILDKEEGLEDPNINIVLASNPIYGKVTYMAINDGNTIKGDIIREYIGIKDLKWYVLIPVIIFFLVIIIPYLIGAIIYYFYSSNSVKKLDKQMKKNGYQKVTK